MKDRSSMNSSAAAPASPDRKILTTPSDLRPSVSDQRDDALLSPPIAIGVNGLVSTKALRSPGALRLHPVFNELNLSGWLINSELQGKPQDVHEPVLITRTGITLGGFA